MTAARVLSVLVPLLLVGGGVLVAASVAMPAYSDGTAYETAYQALIERLYASDQPDFRTASDEFFALQNQYGTRKWLMQDIGASAMAWGLMLFISLGLRELHAPEQRRTWTTRHFGFLVFATLAACALLTLGMIGAVLTDFQRQNLPPWADTMAIPLAGAATMFPFMLVLVSAFSLAPLATPRRPAALFAVKGRGWATSLIVSLIYLPPLLMCALGMISAVSSGGWAFSTGAGVTAWLMLNARAIWLGRTLAD